MIKEWLNFSSWKLTRFLLLAVIILNKFKLSKTDDWEYKLVHDLLSGYDPSIRPSVHHNVTLNVTFGLALAQLIDVDERNMIITTNCWLNQGWIDHKLQWNPDSYDGIEFIHIPTEKIWKPDILLVNNADVWAKSSSISTNAIVKYNGNVTWLSTVIFKSSCSINVRYFPFDEQTCDMIFASWTFDGFFLDINVNSREGDVTNYIKNGEWHLVKLLAIKNLKNYSCCDEPYPEIYYKLIIRRRPLYYVFNMVFPCLLITLVAFLGFYLPPGSTEKVSIGITTLLSITVFLMLVAESMPPTSEQLPLIGIYYAVTIGIVSFSTAMAVVTLNINNKGHKGKKVPRLVKIIFFNYLARIFRTEISTVKKTKLFKKPKLETKSPITSNMHNSTTSDINIARKYNNGINKHSKYIEKEEPIDKKDKLITTNNINNNNNNMSNINIPNVVLNDGESRIRNGIHFNFKNIPLDNTNTGTSLVKGITTDSVNLNDSNNNNNKKKLNHLDDNLVLEATDDYCYSNSHTHYHVSRFNKIQTQIDFDDQDESFICYVNLNDDLKTNNEKQLNTNSNTSTNNTNNNTNTNNNQNLSNNTSNQILLRPTSIVKNSTDNATTNSSINKQTLSSNGQDLINSNNNSNNTNTLFFPPSPLTPVCKFHCMCECSNNSMSLYDNRSAQSIQTCSCNNNNNNNKNNGTSKLKNNSDSNNQESNLNLKKDNEETYVNVNLSENLSTKRHDFHRRSLQNNNNNNSNSNSTSNNNNNNNNNSNSMSYLSPKLNVPSNTNKSSSSPSKSASINYCQNSKDINNNNKDFMLELEKILEKQFSPLVNSLINTVEKNERRFLEREKLELIQSEWSDIARVADHFLCYFFPLMTITVCLLIFLNSPHAFSQW